MPDLTTNPSPKSTNRGLRAWLVHDFKPVTLHDDGGKTCSLVAPPTTWPKRNWLGCPKEPITDAALLAEWKWATAMGVSTGAVVGFMAVPVSGLMLWLLAGTISLPAWAPTFFAAIWVGLAARPSSTLVSRAIRRKHAPYLRAGYLQAGRCPSCGYDLFGIEPQTNGRSRCPECAAEWNLVLNPPAPAFTH